MTTATPVQCPECEWTVDSSELVEHGDEVKCPICLETLRTAE